MRIAMQPGTEGTTTLGSAPHVPSLHGAVATHLRPQAPQLFQSLVRFTHAAGCPVLWQSVGVSD
jgi:hypothetical protein